ncbi:MAG: DUF4440 domain-containing protein [Mongoliibacter sp.]|uniref:DUF4440 domain-containing protein n=1 Tax=Mongoliibacter sp. TaxID=2022438 RepID=UPI0012F35C52|nr:DUF4440 domain-containing protein [Mongoliibacter sp.]TVP48797.1 MAG: DUF4440 domain-containing protein [Mongoliibacter sp.]
MGKRKIKINLATLVIFLVPFFSQAQGNFRKEADISIQQLISDYNSARENRNEDLLKRVLLVDIDQLVSSGEWRRGIEEALEGMRSSSTNNPGKRELEIEKIRYLNEQNAVVDTQYRIISENGNERNMWSTFIVVKTIEGWKIAAIRNMLPA